jgi:chaperonin GroEL (HSP60 family)
MPSLVENAKIALVNAPLEVKKTEVDTKINIHDPATLTAFLKKEESMLYKMVQKVKQSGANVLFCQKGIDDIAQHFLAKENIFAVRRVKKSDLEKLAKATGGNIVTSLDDLSPKDIGSAKFVEQRKIGDENYIFVEECKNPKAVTLFIRGGSEHVVKEIEKALEDAIDDTASALNYGKILAGGGASEIEIAKKLRSYAERIGGKKQLAIKAFAKALEVCPSILAENAGLDPVEKLMALRKVHEDEGKVWWGINVESGTIVDMWKDGVLEPLKLKLQALQSASEVTEMILRVDDVVTAKELEKGKEGPMGGGPCGGGPCGPGGMPPY